MARSGSTITALAGSGREVTSELGASFTVNINHESFSIPPFSSSCRYVYFSVSSLRPEICVPHVSVDGGVSWSLDFNVTSTLEAHQ